MQITGILIGFLGVMGVIAPKLSGLSVGALESLAGRSSSMLSAWWR